MASRSGHICTKPGPDPGAISPIAINKRQINRWRARQRYEPLSSQPNFKLYAAPTCNFKRYVAVQDTIAPTNPDGNTVVLAAFSHNIAGYLYKNLSYGPYKDFTKTPAQFQDLLKADWEAAGKLVAAPSARVE